VLVLQPGSGDSIQALKAGVMEIPDVIVVNKADHPLTDTMLREIRGVLHLGPQADWEIPVLTTEAAHGKGVEELAGALVEHRAHNRARGHPLRAPSPQPDERGPRAGHRAHAPRRLEDSVREDCRRPSICSTRSWRAAWIRPVRRARSSIARTATERAGDRGRASNRGSRLRPRRSAAGWTPATSTSAGRWGSTRRRSRWRWGSTVSWSAFSPRRPRWRAAPSTSLAGAANPGIEPELALRFGVDVPNDASPEQVGAAIDAVAPALELVDLDRPLDDLHAILAGNVFHRGVLVDEFDATRTGIDLAGLSVSVARNGEEAGSVSAAEAYGDLAETIRFVTLRLALMGETLRAGQFVIAGSLTPIVPSRRATSCARTSVHSARSSWNSTD